MIYLLVLLLFLFTSCSSVCPNDNLILCEIVKGCGCVTASSTSNSVADYISDFRPTISGQVTYSGFGTPETGTNTPVKADTEYCS